MCRFQVYLYYAVVRWAHFMVDLSRVGEDNLFVNGGFLPEWFGSFFGSFGSGYMGAFYGAVCSWGWEVLRRKLGFP